MDQPTGRKMYHVSYALDGIRTKVFNCYIKAMKFIATLNQKGISYEMQVKQ